MPLHLNFTMNIGVDLPITSGIEEHKAQVKSLRVQMTKGNNELEKRRVRICELERELGAANAHLYPPMDENLQEKHNDIQGI